MLIVGILQNLNVQVFLKMLNKKFMLLTFEDLIKRPLVWMTLDGKEILKSMGNSMASAYLLVKQKINLSLDKYSISIV